VPDQLEHSSDLLIPALLERHFVPRVAAFTGSIEEPEVIELGTSSANPDASSKPGYPLLAW
jgi:hypothetical protein